MFQRTSLFALATATFLTAQAASATVYYSNTFNMGSTKSTYTSFGIVQNSYGSGSGQWEIYVDNLKYSTQSGSTVTLESQSFNSVGAASSAGWTANAAATTSPNNFGFSNTNIAGGSAGEIGGIFARSAGILGNYADTSVGTIDMSKDLYATGTINLKNGSAANNTIFLGWNNASLNNTNRLGFNIGESGSGGTLSTNARVNLAQSGSGGTTSATNTEVANIQNKVLYWSLSYNATTNELTGIIQDTPFPPVPEPASLGLLGLGGLLMFRRQRRA